MLPSTLASQLKQGLSDYIETTFLMTNPTFLGSLKKLVETKGAVFHEPYISVKLPFRVADEIPDYFEAINQKYKPYNHQLKAFQRLTGEDGKSTLVATGTGSGKTECFLYPILEYCYKHRGESGIKALIIYPMNALASDQAKRIAELINENPKLKGNVTAGMYVGGSEEHPKRIMGKDSVITDHETLLNAPPDILLTNYKMLDYLLVRPKDANLWSENDPETLKYIAVDELHTFDGAQGTDLACLLRRLKSRLYTPAGHLCCIGTSATMGSEENAKHISRYASNVFGESFDEDAVVIEDRQSAVDFFAEFEVKDFTFPSKNRLQELKDTIEDGDESEYLRLATELWFDDNFDKSNIMTPNTRLEIGRRLMEHSFMRSLTTLTDNQYIQTETIYKELYISHPELDDIKNHPEFLDAFFALISHARTGNELNLCPFLTVQVQLWMRELRRLLAKVTTDDIEYAIASDLNEQQAKNYLPVVNCRDCGETGWVSIANERGNLTLKNLNVFYNLYFKQDDNITMVFPHKYDGTKHKFLEASLCPECLQLEVGPEKNHVCNEGGEKLLDVIIPSKLETSGSKNRKQYVCPFCSSKRGLSIIGLRSATAISASVSQMFASRFNDDKKTLAFSDNVQDAAHRAGFFNSRTWRFGLRSAIQRFAIFKGKGLNLEDFSKGFINYWYSQLTKEEFVSYFIAPNMTWKTTYENMLVNGKLTQNENSKKLIREIERRLNYEIMLEYGSASQIGRTLEKSRCSTIIFNNEMVTKVSKNIQTRAINELAALNNSELKVFMKMVVGFLNLVRRNGAFNDTSFYSYTQENGRPYLLSHDYTKWTPGLQAGRNTPTFLIKDEGYFKNTYYFDKATDRKYTDWIHSCIEEEFVREDVFDGMAMIIFSELIKENVLTTLPSKNSDQIWGLNKEELFITTEVKELSCNTCGNIVNVGEENLSYWINAPCWLTKCGGRLEEVELNSMNYYHKLYNNADLERVIAKEHTGLLERDDREALEEDFKRSKKDSFPWDPNLLSCTPTLEMGIDIGDLSTVVLCSVPPGQAQFMQRTGRAGRKDGNALTLAVANAKPHDLYYYAEPEEMLSGAIIPPKVFLRASAVLERQFVAYCLDSWIKKGIDEQAIPKKISVCLSNLSKKSNTVFPFNFLNYIQNNLSKLVRTFTELFREGELDADAINEIKVFVEGDSKNESPMHLKILDAFEQLKKHRDSIRNNVKELGKLIKELEGKPKDSSYEDELKDLKSERRALSGIVKDINNKNIFNFLSDEGLLPNYAFPEAGIILKAILYRKEEDDQPKMVRGKRKYQKLIHEYNRSASSAISEFAPHNSFYVDGRKLKIDQIDLNSSKTAKWRLCPNCSHADIEGYGVSKASCPRCGSLGWADGGQVRSMLKVQMVYSNTDYTKSLIDDESDDRQNIFYMKQMLVDVDEENDVIKAFRMDNEEFPFGYEFVKKAKMREINFGEADTFGEKLTVSGVEDVRKGFTICKHCGKVQQENGKANHTFSCKARNQDASLENPFEECLFLYREFETEALRLLVPATTMDTSNIRQESFTAAFMLGMREYFGNVDHLRATISEVPVDEGAYRKQYLVIYDSVPGGTGYLKQLLQNENALVDIFENALDVLESCSCKEDIQKDGCYHCIYAYQQSQKIGVISRRVAVNLLNFILSGQKNIEEITNLGNIKINSLFESELELRFVEALRRKTETNRSVKVDKTLVNNKEGYQVSINGFLWVVEPQVKLDSADNVSVTSKPDFVIRPLRKSSNHRPIAIFMDGFLYHKDRVADDTLKREAIRRCGDYRVWTLTWKDIHEIINPSGNEITPTLRYEEMPSGSQMFIRTLESEGFGNMKLGFGSSFEILMQYLEADKGEKMLSAYAKAFSWSVLDMSNISKELMFNEWRQKLSPLLEYTSDNIESFPFRKTIFSLWHPRGKSSHMLVVAGVNTEAITKNKRQEVTIYAILEDQKEFRSDRYEADWNGFWHFYNVMQFLDTFMAFTETGLQQDIYNELEITDYAEIESAQFSLSANAEEWELVKEQILDEEIIIILVDSLIKNNMEPPSSVGFELENENSKIIAQAELAWEERKIAILLPEQNEYKPVFEKLGWKAFDIQNLKPSDLNKGGK
ncbi:DEAD/DEAH box helicase [Isachenkonia alkalipeptolytica]|uniref:DEAD/DEAH box helicase n=1 Tax=Isachenkonia alkalipeptolytica TaxID=2565777 RepID=A0AA43XJT0_9CLOT|nr:DEAD/DEAH box helicase [Isachenkonia alkalipeptolytica]NBG88128.1 DEAD/DEAH box helicase [Isachenkonia alkalipeptolytica]